MVEQHRRGEDRGGRVGLALTRDVWGGAVDRLEHARGFAGGVDVAARGQPDAAGDGRGDVGDDVAEKVVGDDDVEACRVGREEDRRGVDVLVGGLDVGELRADLLDGAAPQVTGVGEHVVLVDERQVLARARLGAGEGVTHDPLDAESGVDADLGRDLVRGADAQRAAVADVGPLGALADDDEVEPLARHVLGERAGDAGEELGRAQVDVVVERKAKGEQHAPLEDAGGDARVADGAEEDAVVAAQLLDDGVGQGLAGAVPAGRAEVVLGGAEVDAGGAEDLQALRDNLGADAVAADDGDVEAGLRCVRAHVLRLGARPEM